MSKIINLNEAKEKLNPIVLGASYYMDYTDEDGTVHKLELTGDETFSTTCPICRKEFSIEFYTFCSFMGVDGSNLYGTMIHCIECSAKNIKAMNSKQ